MLLNFGQVLLKCLENAPRDDKYDEVTVHVTLAWIDHVRLAWVDYVTPKKHITSTHHCWYTLVSLLRASFARLVLLSRVTQLSRRVI